MTRGDLALVLFVVAAWITVLALIFAAVWLYALACDLVWRRGRRGREGVI